jgi:hypothetical protein
VLPKTAGSAQTYKSISFIWIVWKTLYIYIFGPRLGWYSQSLEMAKQEKSRKCLKLPPHTMSWEAKKGQTLFQNQNKENLFVCNRYLKTKCQRGVEGFVLITIQAQTYNFGRYQKINKNCQISWHCFLYILTFFYIIFGISWHFF